MVQRAPQVVEFYHSLMKRDSRKDSSNGGIYDAPDVANVRSNMIGEIENRSSYLLAVSTCSFLIQFVNYFSHFNGKLIGDTKVLQYQNRQGKEMEAWKLDRSGSFCFFSKFFNT